MTFKPQIILSSEHHNGKLVICLKFKYNQTLINRIKDVTTAGWNASQGWWYLEQDSFKLSIFFEQFKDLAYINYSALKQEAKQEEVKGSGKTQLSQIVSLLYRMDC